MGSNFGTVTGILKFEKCLRVKEGQDFTVVMIMMMKNKSQRNVFCRYTRTMGKNNSIN